MKTLRIVVAMLVFGGVGLGTARAATELELYEAKIGKYATKDIARPRGYCLCQGAGPLSEAVGRLVSYRDLTDGTTAIAKVRCEVPLFDLPAETSGLALNCVAFEVLSK